MIYDVGIDFRPKSPRGNQELPVTSSWSVMIDLIDQDTGQAFQKRLWPFWSSVRGRRDLYELKRLAELSGTIDWQLILSDEFAGLEIIPNVVQMVRIISMQSIKGAQAFDVLPNFMLPVFKADDIELNGCMTRKKALSMIDFSQVQKSTEKGEIIPHFTIHGLNKSQLGRPEVGKLRQLRWAYDAPTYQQDKLADLRYFFQDVNCNEKTKETHLAIYSDFDLNDMVVAYDLVKDKSKVSKVTYWLEDKINPQIVKSMSYTLEQDVNYFAQKHAMFNFFDLVQHIHTERMKNNGKD